MTTTGRTENDVVADIARQSTEPRRLELGGYYVVHTAEGYDTVDLTGNQYRDQPRRKTGTVTVRDVHSMAQYWLKHANYEASEVYADIAGDLVLAVFDAHEGDTPGWGEHRLAYNLQRTDAWKTWAAYDGKLLAQTAFAELLEARLPDIAEPDGADLLELAQTFEATTSVAFKSGSTLASGARELVYTEQVQASGGRDKKITIPKGITLHIAPYEDSDPIAVTARFRYRINDGQLRLGYALNQPADRLREAFEDVVEKVETTLGVSVMRGRPAA